MRYVFIYLICINRPVLLGRLTLVGKALSFTHKLSFFLGRTSFIFFFINPPRSAAAQWTAIKCISEDRLSVKIQQLVRISRPPPLIFTAWGQEVRHLASFSTLLNFEPLTIENAARCLNAETNFLCRNDRLMSLSSLVKLGSRTPENRLSVVPTPKIAQRKHAKPSITQRGIIRFRSNCVASLNARHPKCYKSSRSRGQRSRSQHDMTCAKIRQIINNSAGDSRFRLNFVPN